MLFEDYCSSDCKQWNALLIFIWVCCIN